MKKPLIKSLMTKQKKLRSYRCPVAFHFSAKSVDCHLSVQFLSFLHPDDKQVVSLFSDTSCINAKKAVLSETNTYAAASRKIYLTFDEWAICQVHDEKRWLMIEKWTCSRKDPFHKFFWLWSAALQIPFNLVNWTIGENCHKQVKIKRRLEK